MALRRYLGEPALFLPPHRRIEGTACLLVHFTIRREGTSHFRKTGQKGGGFIPFVYPLLHQLCSTRGIGSLFVVDELCDGVLMGFFV